MRSPRRALHNRLLAGHGLLPWLYGAADLNEYASNLARASLHLGQGEGCGWSIIDQLSPTPESFDGWAEPARNGNGELIACLLEIPNDDLSARSGTAQPASGVSGRLGNEAIAMVWGQTRTDAKLLRIRLDFGVPLVVPVFGRLMAWTLRSWDGCEVVAPKRLGVLNLGTPGNPIAPRLWRCLMDSCSSQGGAAPTDRPRIRVRMLVTVRMYSPAREAGIGGGLGQGLAPFAGSASGLASKAPSEEVAASPQAVIKTPAQIPREPAADAAAGDSGSVGTAPQLGS